MLGRSVLKTLKQTTLLTLFEVLTFWGLKADEHYIYNQQESTITFFNESVIYLKDLAYYPSDPNYDALGSTEFTGGGIDEANQVQSRAREVVISRFRYRLDDFGLIPKLIMSCNPSKGWAYSDFYKPWRDGTLAHYRAFIPALVTDNPYISQHYIESLRRLKDPALRERLLNGNWEYDDDPNALFDADTLRDLFTNILAKPDHCYITCDTARLGRDKCVIMVWRALTCIHITTYDRSRLTQVQAEIERLRATYGVPRSRVLIDEDGVGGGIVDNLDGVKGFQGGSSPIQDTRRELEAEQPGYKVNYQNLRAQCFYTLGEYVREHKVAIICASPEEQEMIIAELEQIKGRDVEKDGKLKIVAKDEIKQNIGRSPDYADCVSMRLWFELQPEPTEFYMDSF